LRTGCRAGHRPSRASIAAGRRCQAAGGREMDRANGYREVIKRLLREREKLARPSLPEGLEVTCLFDDTTGLYALLTIGWLKQERVSGTTLLLRIKDGRIGVEEDWTDAPIVDDLVDAGIPRQDIILAFQPPEARASTEHAVA